MSDSNNIVDATPKFMSGFTSDLQIHGQWGHVMLPRLTVRVLSEKPADGEDDPSESYWNQRRRWTDARNDQIA